MDNLSDFEMTKLCAEAMCFDHRGEALNPDGDLPVLVVCRSGLVKYDPLHDDAQAMALVKEYPVEGVDAMARELEDFMQGFLGGGPRRLDLNRAVVKRICAGMVARK